MIRLNTEALATLGRNAEAFAKCYVQVVEAMMREGVPEMIARPEARMAALDAAFMEPERREDWEK